MRKDYTFHSREEKLELVERCLAGESSKQLGKETGVSDGNILREQSAQFSVAELCELYEVSRSGYYKWLKRAGQLNRYEYSQTILDEYVKDVHAHYPSMGYRQIRDTLLLQTGWKVCDLSAWKSMRRLGIQGYVRKSRYPAASGNEHKDIPNVLCRQFRAERPLQKIASDITYIKYRGHWFYLVCFLDLFNNEIIEWELSSSFDNAFVIRSARRLLEKAKCTGTPILLHSDQGNQYISAGYQALLREYNATQSMSRAGTPRDNAVIDYFRMGWFFVKLPPSCTAARYR